MREHISGVILLDETLRQKVADGTPLAQVIADTGEPAASKSMPEPSQWPDMTAKWSRKGWMACATA